jgi:mono/diheme cytochrome c family protein
MFRNLFLAALFACWAQGAVAAETSQQSRGHYLALEGDCAVCHTRAAPESPLFAGGYPLHAAPGTVYSSNITPDKLTGIGNWNADQFYRALHKGVSADGRHLYPAFPYVYFARLSRADSDALFAYLKTVKPVRYQPPASKLIFPMNIRALMVFWNALYLDSSPFKPDPSQSQVWNRGAKIVLGAGHCGACHSPKNLLFADTRGSSMKGNLADGWYAPNLTRAKPDGLGDWTAADIEQYLKTGENRFTHVTGAMRDVVQKSTSQMTDADRAAIATYIKSLPPDSNSVPKAPDQASMQAGQAVFVARCAVCHTVRGAGNADYPSLAHNTMIVSQNPDTVLRVILQGSQSVKTANGTVGFSMPAFPVLTNADLADVATYIRNSWGNRGEPVSAKQTKKFRKLLASGD